jgi:hypothetical protein
MRPPRMSKGVRSLYLFVYDDGGRETSRAFGNSLMTTTSDITGENLIDTLTNSTVVVEGCSNLER